jgi:hypothetical protein
VYRTISAIARPTLFPVPVSLLLLTLPALKLPAPRHKRSPTIQVHGPTPISTALTQFLIKQRWQNYSTLDFWWVTFTLCFCVRGSQLISTLRAWPLACTVLKAMTACKQHKNVINNKAILLPQLLQRQFSNVHYIH